MGAKFNGLRLVWGFRIMTIERKLKAGNIDIYCSLNENLHSFCINAYLLAGSMYETVNENGITHLYEHVVFRNLKRLYGGELYRLLAENGLLLDASTYKEFMLFSIHGLAEGIDFAIDVISKLFLPLEISAEEYEAEKRRIYAEMNEDAEKTTLEWLHGRCCWGEAFPAAGIIGRRSNIERSTLKRLDAFRERILSAGSPFLYVTGNVDIEHLNKLSSAADGIHIPQGSLKRENTVRVSTGFKFGSPNIKIMDSDWCRVMLSFGFDSKETPMNIREMLYSALYEFDDCAFYQELTEEDPTAYSFNGVLEQYNNLGCFTLSYETLESELVRSLEAVVRALNRIKRGEFDVELNRKKLAAKHTLLLDDPTDLNWDMAYYNHILESGKVDWSKPALGRFEELTMETLTEAAIRVFTRKNLVLTLRGNRNKIKKNEIESVISKL